MSEAYGHQRRSERHFSQIFPLISPKRLAVWVGVLEAHLLQLAAAVKLIVSSVGLLSEILHVHAD